MSDAEFELMIELILVFGLLLLSFAYVVAMTAWANDLIRKCRKLREWIERERST